MGTTGVMGVEGEDNWARGVREAWVQCGEDPRPQGVNLLVDSQASSGRAPPSAALEELQGVGRGERGRQGWGGGFGNHQARPGQLQPRHSTCL